MPRKGGQMTQQERNFARFFAESGDRVSSATRAGYKAPQPSSSRAMARPEVLAEIRRIQEQRLTKDLLPLAVGRLERILRDEKSTERGVIAAAKLVMDRVYGAVDPAEGKQPHEMTAAELQTSIDALRQAATRLRADVPDAEIVQPAPAALEHTPDDVEGADDLDVFG